MKNEKIAVLLTTDNTKRGVFAGLINPKDAPNETIEVEEIRMAVYWDSEVGGVLGLAATGPNKNCKITKAAPKAIIKGVTAVVELTPEALKNWRKEFWKD